MTKSYSNEIRIPTLLVLAILIVGLGSGIVLLSQKQLFKSQAGPTTQPKNITLANLTASSASIIWQTDKEIAGFIQAGLTSSLGQTFLDDRDLNQPNTYKLHFVTLTNLKPQTTYYYKIISSEGASQMLTLTTSLELPQSQERPLIGRVLDSKLQPINEALVTLEIKGVQKLATITKISGNFILPLAGFNIIQASSSAKLIIFRPNDKSVVNLRLPIHNPILPTITLGKDLDLTLKATLDSNKPLSATASASTKKYDLNKDGVINALDYSIVVDNLGKIKRKDADVNSDSIVDQKDLDLLNKVLSDSIR